MKTLTLRFSLFIGCIVLSLIKLSAGNGVPPLPVDQGVSAPFAGTAGHWQGMAVGSALRVVKPYGGGNQ